MIGKFQNEVSLLRIYLTSIFKACRRPAPPKKIPL